MFTLFTSIFRFIKGDSSVLIVCSPGPELEVYSSFGYENDSIK